MEKNQLLEISKRVEERVEKGDSVLLKSEELDTIDRKEIYQIACAIKSLDTSFSVQWYYWEHRVRSNEQLLEEVEEEIREFETKYGGNFHSLYGHLSLGEIDGLNHATDLFDWMDLIERRDELQKREMPQ